MGFVIQMAPGEAGAALVPAYSSRPTTRPGAIWARRPRSWSAGHGLSLLLRPPHHDRLVAVDRHEIAPVGGVHRRRGLLGGGAGGHELLRGLLEPGAQLVDLLLQL